jgi:hypothetical protein
MAKWNRQLVNAAGHGGLVISFCAVGFWIFEVFAD